MSSNGTKSPAVWYVTGGKGGVGKSTVTVNLAVDLSRRGRRELLCDLDLGLANVDGPPVALGEELGPAVVAGDAALVA